MFRTTMIAAVALVAPCTASAQALVCTPPARIERPHPDLPTADQPRRLVPTGGYTLALTWNPAYCRANAREPGSAFRCGSDARFGFALHGLWPDGRGKAWPQYCRKTGVVPPAVIRQTLCATPSAQLIQHEWAKHGTCMQGSPADYFGRSTRLYGAIRYPDMAALSRAPLTVGAFKAAMARANPGIGAEMMRVTVTRQGWLDELWFCLDTRFRYERCKPGTGGAPDAARLSIWRGAR